MRGGKAGKKSDVQDPLPVSLEDAPEPDAAPPTPQLADRAWRSAAAAIGRGKVHEARAWMKLWKELKTVIAEDEEQARRAEAAARWQEQRAAKALEDEALAKALAESQAETRAAVRAEAQLHPLHPDFEVQSDDAAPAAPPSLVARQALVDALGVEISRGGRRAAVVDVLVMLRDALSDELVYERSSG